MPNLPLKIFVNDIVLLYNEYNAIARIYFETLVINDI